MLDEEHGRVISFFTLYMAKLDTKDCSASSFYQILILLVLHAYICETCMTKLETLKNCSASFFYQILILLVLHAYVCETPRPFTHPHIRCPEKRRKKIEQKVAQKSNVYSLLQTTGAHALLSSCGAHSLQCCRGARSPTNDPDREVWLAYAPCFFR